MSGIVFCGLVAWLLLCLASGAIPVAGPGRSAALLAPLFASAPTLARYVIAPRADRAPAAPAPEILAPEVAAKSSQETPNEPRGIAGGESRVADPDATAIPASDVGDAVRFALRHARRQVDAKGISLTAEMETDLRAACDQQTCRRMMCALMDHALGNAAAGGSVSISARKVRRVVLLRLRSDSRPDTGCAGDQPLAAARAMIEVAGGTLVEDCTRDGLSLSVRLDLAAVPVAMNPPTGSTGAD